MTTRKITQLFNIDIDTVKTLSEIVSDKDGNGFLSAEDTVNGAAVHKEDFSSTELLSEFLSQATHRRVEILSSGNGMYHYLAYSKVSASSELSGVFHIASDPYKDYTADRLIYAASEFTEKTEEGLRLTKLWKEHSLTGDALLYSTTKPKHQGACP
jgi:hypothetical protein